MNSATKTLFSILLLLSVGSALSACGQKGPLEVERPTPVQEEEPAETK